jgi:hypothetical protein
MSLMTFLVKVKVTLQVGVTERVNVPSENEILSDVPDDIFSESESDTAGGSDRESECAE